MIDMKGNKFSNQIVLPHMSIKFSSSIEEFEN